MVMNVLYYIFAWIYIPYDVFSYVMIIGVRLRETHFGNLYFQTPLKLNLYMFTIFYNWTRSGWDDDDGTLIA